MQATSAQYQTTIARQTLTVAASVSLTLPAAAAAYQDVSVSLVSAEIDQDLTTDQPAGTRDLTGYPAQTATITLAGRVGVNNDQNVGWLFGPYQTTSPLYRTSTEGIPVKITASVYNDGIVSPESFVKFVGYVDTAEVKPDGSVVFTCIDRRNDLRSVPVLPPAYSLPTNPYHLTALYAVDSILFANGYYSGPPPRNGTFFYASQHGGSYPQKYPLGNIAQYYNSGNPVPGKYAGSVADASWFQVQGQGTSGSNANLQIGTLAMTTTSAYEYEAWVRNDGSGNGVAVVVNNLRPAGFLNASMVLGSSAAANTVTPGQPLIPSVLWYDTFQGVSFAATSTTLTVPADGTFHYVYIKHQVTGGNLVGTFQVDSASQTVSTAVTFAQTNTPTMGLSVQQYVPTDSSQVALIDTGTPSTGVRPTWAPTTRPVVLDASLNNMVAMPDVSGLDSWGVLQALAAAEGAVCGFDETGTFRFRNRRTIRSSSVAKAITAGQSLTGVTTKVATAALANHVTLTVNPVTISGLVNVWSASAVLTLAPGQSYSTAVTLDNAATAVQPLGTSLASASNVTGFRANKKIDGTGLEVTNLTMTAQQVSPASVIVKLYNPNSYPVYLVYVSGGNPVPGVFVVGRTVTTAGTDGLTGTSGGASAQVVEAYWQPSLAARGEILLDLPASTWRQTVDQYTQAYVNDTLSNLSRAIPVWEEFDVLLDPSLQLVDRVTVTDPDGSNALAGEQALVTNLHTTISASDWKMSVTASAIGTPGGWILGVAGRSNLSTSTYT